MRVLPGKQKAGRHLGAEHGGVRLHGHLQRLANLGNRQAAARIAQLVQAPNRRLPRVCWQLRLRRAWLHVLGCARPARVWLPGPLPKHATIATPLGAPSLTHARHSMPLDYSTPYAAAQQERPGVHPMQQNNKSAQACTQTTPLAVHAARGSARPGAGTRAEACGVDRVAPTVLAHARPNTTMSRSELAPRRLAPCTDAQAASPAAISPGTIASGSPSCGRTTCQRFMHPSGSAGFPSYAVSNINQ